MRPAALALALLLAAPLGRAPAAQPVQSGQVLDGLVAVVGGEVVLRSEVDALATQASGGQAITADVWSRALDEIVKQKVLVVHARRDTTIQVADDYVDQQLDQQLGQMASQAGGMEALEAYYRRSNEEIKALFREDVRDQMMAEQFRFRRLASVTVTPGEVREWFGRIPEAELPMVPELVRVAHIVKVPSPTPEAVAEARAFAGALRDSVVSGQATIEDIATRHSKDGGSAARGGLIADIRLALLVPEFAAVAGSIEPGAYSEVFETPFGYHVLRVNERAGGVVSFNHFLITVDGGESAEAAARAELVALRDSIQTGGASFVALAREHSEDPSSAARGGIVSDPRTGERDLRIDALGPQWLAALEGLEVGAISEPAPVRLLSTGAEALHIVRLQKRTPEHRLSLEDDYALLSGYALQEKKREVFERWVRGLQASIFVQIKDDRYVPPTQPQAAAG